MDLYPNKQALIDEILNRYNLFSQEFSTIAEQNASLRIDGVDRTPKEMIAYQLGWLNLVYSWDKDELAGKEVRTPHPDYKWNQLGPMYQSFYQTYTEYSLAELLLKFDIAVQEWLKWIDSLNEKELNQQGVRNWTGTNPKWPMIRWIHINSVAPFKTFRSKIRKWKKLQLLN